MSEPLEALLVSTLRLRSGSTNVLRNREGTELEFKQAFSLGSRAKYAKSMAAFANNRGGFLIFGVEPNPHKLRGVNRSNFDSFDPADLTRFLNASFSPEIHWEMGVAMIHGVDLGYLYAAESRDKPVVATHTHGDDIREGAIYFRYRGQALAIRYPELRGILDERIDRERNAWLQHLQVIGRAGPTNVGIVDTVQGRLYGGGSPFLIDDALLRKLKFIRKGQFVESGGEPTLTLVGDLQSVQGGVQTVAVPTAIHADDLISSFLAQRTLSSADAQAYLLELTYQNTPILPIHFFVSAAGLTKEQAADLIRSSASTLAGQKNRLLKRLSRVDVIKPQGALEEVSTAIESLSVDAVLTELSAWPIKAQQRNLLYKILRRRPEILLPQAQHLPLTLTCEALTHLSKADVLSQRQSVLQLLLQLSEARAGRTTSGERTALRKAVCLCDELLAAV